MFSASKTLHIRSTSSSTLSLKLFTFWGRCFKVLPRLAIRAWVNELAATFQQFRLISDIYLFSSRTNFFLDQFSTNQFPGIEFRNHRVLEYLNYNFSYDVRACFRLSVEVSVCLSFCKKIFFRPKWIKFANSVNRHLEF